MIAYFAIITDTFSYEWGPVSTGSQGPRDCEHEEEEEEEPVHRIPVLLNLDLDCISFL